MDVLQRTRGFELWSCTYVLISLYVYLSMYVYTYILDTYTYIFPYI